MSTVSGNNCILQDCIYLNYCNIGKSNNLILDNGFSLKVDLLLVRSDFADLNWFEFAKFEYFTWTKSLWWLFSEFFFPIIDGCHTKCLFLSYFIIGIQLHIPFCFGNSVKEFLFPKENKYNSQIISEFCSCLQLLKLIFHLEFEYNLH